MDAALVLLVARHEVAAVVAEEEEDGVGGEVLLVEDAHDAADGVVDALAGSVVVGQLGLPVAGEVAEVGRDEGVGEALGRALGTDDAVLHIVLLVRLELRDEEEEGLRGAAGGGSARRGR